MLGEIILVAVIMALAFGAYWAMVLFPKQRDFQKRQNVVRSLSRGDEVITYGGMIGTVIDIDAEAGIAQVEIADGVVVRLIMAALVQEYNADEIAQNARIALGRAAEVSVNE